MNEKKRRYDDERHNNIPEWTKTQKENQARNDFLSFTDKKMKR